MNMLRTPIGNVTVYPSNESQPRSVITDDAWQQLSPSDYLLNQQHSIDNFALDNPKSGLDTLQFSEGQEFVLGTTHKEIFPQYTNGVASELHLQLYRPNVALSHQTPSSRFLSSTHVHSNDLSRFKFNAYSVGVYSHFSESTITIVDEQAYLNVPITFKSRPVTAEQSYVLRILPTPTTGAYFIEELSYIDSGLAAHVEGDTYQRVAWSAPTPVWHLANQGRMPLSVEFLTDYDIALHQYTTRIHGHLVHLLILVTGVI